MKKRILIGAVIFTLMGSAISGKMIKAEETTDVITYDAAEFKCFQGHTKEEIGDRYGEALYAGESYVDTDRNTYYETMYSLENPYVTGKLTEDTHKTMTAMTNFYRWLVGVEPLAVSSEHSDKLQAEALVRNFEFNHTVSDSSKPEDMSQEFWDYGAKEYLHTILSRYSTPRGSVTNWMNEGYSLSYGQWDTVGHRYALIGASVSDVQYGYAGSIAAGQEKAYENTMNTPFSAFPAPGYMPTNLVQSSISAWSIQMNREKLSIAESSEVVVKVTNLDTSESYECTVANNKLKISGSILAFVQPALTSGKRYTGSYRVDVEGLTDVASGKAAVLTYTTEFFDPTEYTPSYVKTVTADGIEKYIIYETTATTENLQKIAYALPSEVTVITENGRKAQVPVTGKWILDEEKQCWTNQADATKLPEDITDREHMLEQCAIYYDVSSSIFDAYNSLSISPSAPNIGDEGYMAVYLTLISADTSAIFQLIPQEDGTYIGTKRFDSRTSEEFDGEASEDYHIYHISSYQAGDAGEYFSIYYNSDDTCAYVSTNIKTLTVNGSTQSDGNQQNGSGSGSGTTSGADTGSGVADTSGRTDVTNSEKKNTIAGTGTPNGGTAAVKAPKVTKVKKFKAVVKKKAKKKTLVLTWKKNAKADGYQIQISPKKSFKKAKLITLKKSKRKYRISKLKPKKKYYVRIRAYRSYKNGNGKTRKALGKWVVIRK